MSCYSCVGDTNNHNSDNGVIAQGLGLVSSLWFERTRVGFPRGVKNKVVIS
jgi:hypothetical protein